MPQTFIVKLNVRQRPGYLSAVCADVPGLHIVDATLEGIRQRALKAVPVLLKANKHINVKVAPMDDLTEIRVTQV